MRSTRFPYFVYITLLLLISFKLFQTPKYNWDMLPYMAVLFNYDEVDVGKAHQQVYAQAKQEVPVEAYKWLIDTSNLHRKRALHETHFFSSLYPMYVVKPFYTRTCWLLYKMGVSLPVTTYFVSIIFYFLTGVLLLYWVSRYFKPVVSAVLSSVIMIMPFMMEAACLSTPDMCSALLVLTAMFFLVERKQFGTAGCFFIVSIFARIDNVIPATIFLTGYQILSQEHLSWKKYFLILSGVIASFLYVSSLASRYGFSWMYADSYINKMRSSDTITQVNMTDARFILSQISSGIRHSSFAVFIVIGLFLLLFLKRKKQLNWVLFAIGICVLIRFLLQPVIADRFFIPYYLLIIVIVLMKM